MFPGKIFSKERSLLLFWRKLPDSYASCNGENFIVSKRVRFRLLVLAVRDPMKTEITIAYPEHDIMECTLVVMVFSVNAGKVINTQREVVEVVSLMLSKSLILCVHPEASWNLRHVLHAFLLLSWSSFSNDGKYKGIWSQRGSVIFELCKCKSYIFTVVTLSRSKMESPSRTIKSWLFQGL